MSQIRTGAILSYIGLGINILIGLIYTPWMIHSIGQDNYGLFTLAMSIISLFVFDFGLSSAVTRYIAKYLAEGRPQKANDCLGLAYKLYLFIDFILFLILLAVYFFIPEIYESLSDEEIQKFKIVYIIASVFSVVSFPFIPLNGVLNASEKFIQLKLCELANKLIIVVAMSICLVLGYGLYALVLVNACAGLIMIILKIICVLRFTRIRVNFEYRNPKEQKELLHFSGWTTIISVSQRMIFNLAPSILGIMSGSASIAIIGVAITIEGYTFAFANGINGLFLPRVSRILKTGENQILPLMIKVGRIELMIISSIVIGFLCLGQEFINLWVGEHFSTAYICALLFILPSLVQMPQEIASTAIIAANKVKHQAYVFIIMALSNLILAFVFTKLCGVIGLSVSICIAYFIRTFGMNVLYKRYLDIDIHTFFARTYKPFTIPIFISIIIGGLLNILLDGKNWLVFIIKVLLLSFVIALSLWQLGMNKDEKAMICSLLKIK